MDLRYRHRIECSLNTGFLYAGQSLHTQTDARTGVCASLILRLIWSRR